VHLTQPALSRQEKDLEDEIGDRLLVRGESRHEVLRVGCATRRC
jgi:DNA-binding transcriptional LysR family regulator